MDKKELGEVLGGFLGSLLKDMYQEAGGDVSAPPDPLVEPVAEHIRRPRQHPLSNLAQSLESERPEVTVTQGAHPAPTVTPPKADGKRATAMCLAVYQRTIGKHEVPPDPDALRHAFVALNDVGLSPGEVLLLASTLRAMLIGDLGLDSEMVDYTADVALEVVDLVSSRERNAGKPPLEL